MPVVGSAWPGEPGAPGDPGDEGLLARPCGGEAAADAGEALGDEGLLVCF